MIRPEYMYKTSIEFPLLDKSCCVKLCTVAHKMGFHNDNNADYPPGAGT